MPWSVTEDVDEFAAATGPFLRARPAQHTVELTITETLLVRGPHAFGPLPPLLGWWQAAGGPVSGAFIQTPPFPLLISSTPAESVPELAVLLAEHGRELPGVNAEETAAARFAARWQHTGASATVHQRTRLFRLGTLVPPRSAPAGRARLATSADREVLLDWFGAFSREAGELAERDHAGEVDDRIGYGGLTVWEDGGAAVCMAGLTRRVAGTVRVGPVYTPPALRRRGYAGAATAAVTQAALAAGVRDVLLFTDLANPTSNGLYQRLGYHPIEDRVILSFTG